jgi:hypothetical protein
VPDRSTGQIRCLYRDCGSWDPSADDAGTTVGRQIADATGLTNGLEVTDDVFRSPASIVFD